VELLFLPSSLDASSSMIVASPVAFVAIVVERTFIVLIYFGVDNKY
jgi:hypothetical protein